MRALFLLMCLAFAAPALAFPNSFQEFKLGMPLSTLSSLRSNVIVRQSGHYITSRLTFSKTRQFNAFAELESGQSVQLTLGYYNRKLALISVLYSPIQDPEALLFSLITKYGVYDDKTQTYWGSVKIDNYYWNFPCCILNFHYSRLGAPELIFADAAAQVAILEEIRADEAKLSKE